MEPQKTKIPFYLQRTFTEKINASFDFIKENWKPLLKYSTYLILPICLLQGVSFNAIMTKAYDEAYLESLAYTPDNSELISFILNYLLLILFFSLGAFIMTSLVYTLVKTYNDRENGLEGISFNDIKSLLLGNIGRLLMQTLIAILLVTGAVIVISLLGMLSGLTLILTIPLLFVMAIPLSLWTPVYLYEHTGVIESLTKSYKLGMATWGGIFAVMFVMGFITNIVQGVASLPWGVSTIVNQLFRVSEAGMTGEISIGNEIMTYLFSVMAGYGLYLSMVFTMLGISYQYAHANEKVGHVSVEKEIENFDQF